MHQLGYHHRLGYQFPLYYISASQTGQGTMRIRIDFFLLRFLLYWSIMRASIDYRVQMEVKMQYESCFVFGGNFHFILTGFS